MKTKFLIILTILLSKLSISQNLLTDSTSTNKAIDSLKILKDKICLLKDQKDSLFNYLNYIQIQKDSSQKQLNELNLQMQTLEQDIQLKNSLLQKQINLLEEKEKIFNQKEQIYKDAIYASKIDSVELTGKINTQNALLEGKADKITILQQQIYEKEKHIEQKEFTLQHISKQRSIDLKKIDSLQYKISFQKESIYNLQQDSLKKDMQLALIKEKNENLIKSLDNCQNSEKKKTIRLVQGVAFKSFRTPKYELSPKDYNNVSVYEIHNKNKGSFEVDYITGVSLKFAPIFTKKDKYANDLGLFIGFGGKDLFKNFYLGPNIKLLNAFHINAGINLREYEVLKEGFDEGDTLATGTSIPTDNEWKINWYAGLTFDFSLIADVAKKL